MDWKFAERFRTTNDDINIKYSYVEVRPSASASILRSVHMRQSDKDTAHEVRAIVREIKKMT